MPDIPRASCTTPDCAACGEGNPRDECLSSQMGDCGHHCNHSWTHDSCCWCGATFGEDGAVTVPEPIAVAHNRAVGQMRVSGMPGF